MKDIKDTIAELLKTGLAHSIAQTFLIFSGIIVIVSVIYHAEKIYILLISFSTLFYALIAHYLTALRKHESLGKYAVGNYFWQSVLFTAIFILYFIWWAMSVWAILCAGVSFFVSIITLILALILTLIWLFCMFYNKRKIEKDLTGHYKVKCVCKNCDLDREVENIPQKRPLHDHPCPDCGLYELEKKEKEKHLKWEIIVLFKTDDRDQKEKKNDS